MIGPGGGTLTISLGWPDKALSPNARIHWASIAKVKKAAREEAFWLTRQAMGATFGPTVTKIAHDGTSDIIIKQTAHPPDKRARDRDNLDHAMKASRDGIADALGVNDRFFRSTGISWGEVHPGGRIVIEVAA